jgi:tetratricopeptide (TPR) repeat protein
LNTQPNPWSFSEHKRLFWPCLLLAAATMALYWPATRFNFVALDDDAYVYDNPWVTHGLDWSTAKWVWTSTYAANWHPVTWLSHLLDSSIYGPLPDGPHFTNVCLHALNALLLFLVLSRLTGAPWPSWVAAALFAWHPLRVESVAWISERKDLLCGLFWMLTLWAYLRYAEEFKVQPAFAEAAAGKRSKFKVFYALILLFFALGLMSKPMMVTLPFVLLLLDYWPLGRLEFGPKFSWRPVMEKVPFLVLAAGSSLATFLVQHAGGAVKSFQQAPFLLRAANVPLAYISYIGKTLWPTHLCAFYPLSDKAPELAATGSALALAAITGLTVRWRREYPWLLVGWFWFMGTLIPVIGLVQVGGQALADRYTYLPSIGLFIMLAWSVRHWLTRRPAAGPWVGGAAFLGLLGCVLATERQLPYWRDSLALYGRILWNFPDCAGAQNGLGLALSDAGRRAEAMDHYKEALRLDPDSVHAHYNLGIELAEAGKLEEAMIQFDAALKLNPRSEQLHNNVGVVLAREGSLQAALEQFQRAIKLNPLYPKPYLNAAMALERLGRMDEARTNYQKAAQLDPALRSSTAGQTVPPAADVRK